MSMYEITQIIWRRRSDRRGRNRFALRRRNTDRAGRRDASHVYLCLADDRLEVGAWSNGQPFATQLPMLRRQLIGEFDQPSATGLRDLARLYIRFGFGAEAEALLASFGAAPALDDRALLIDLARAVEDRLAAPDGPLAVGEPCPGQHGLWLALGGVAPVFHDPETFAAVQVAFEALPPDLRLLVGPGLAGRLLDAEHPAEARLIFDTTVRAGESPDAALALIGARLAAAEGQPIAAVQTLTALVESSGHTSVEALAQLVRIALDAGMPIPERIVTDLRAAALVYRGTDREVELRRLLIASLGRRADLPAAVREARAAARDLPAAAPGFEALAVAVLAGADPAEAGPGAYAETVLAAADLVGRTAADDPARTTIARQLIALGLPDPALRMIAPGLAAGAGPARLLAAEARLRLNQPEAARAALGALAGPELAQIRARAFALSGAYDEALDRARPWRPRRRGRPLRLAGRRLEPGAGRCRCRPLASRDGVLHDRPRGRGPRPGGRSRDANPRGGVPGAAAAARPAEPRRSAPAARDRRTGRRFRSGRAGRQLSGGPTPCRRSRRPRRSRSAAGASGPPSGSAR